MKVFYIFVSFYCLASVTVASRYKKENPKYLPKANECGKDQIQQPPIFRSRNLMIFGGDEAKHEDYPFSARVGVTRYKRGVENTYEKYTDWVCGGTLINSWYVVTAAHCHGVNEGRQITRVRLGGDGLFAQDFAIKVKDVIVHERYKRCLTTVQNDIALIRLPHAAQMSAQVASACLPLHRNRVAKQLRIRNLGHGLVGEKITVVGSGYSGYANEYSLEFNKESALNKLHVLEMPVKHKSKCREARSPDRFCAGGEIGKDTCRGDSGGGAFLGNKFDPDGPFYLIGIISSGSRFCGFGKPRGFTRMTKYVPWIKKHLR